MNILHIESSILGQHSVTRLMGERLVDHLLAQNPHASLTRRDLVADPLPHLSGAEFLARGSDAVTDRQLAHDLARAQTVMAEFMGADVIVLGAPMYNFGVPSQLKAWVDRITVAGVSFRYSEQGPIGLAGGKTVFVVSGRGSVFTAGGPMASLDHQEPYLNGLFAFLGIEDVRFIRAEGVAMGPDARTAALDRALAQIADVRLDAAHVHFFA